MNKAYLSTLILAGVLSACSSQPSVTDQDILIASNRGELLSLYSQLEDELKDVKPSSATATEIRLNLGKVGKKIAQEKERQILDRLDRDIPGQTMTVLSQTIEDALALEPYDSATYLALRLELEQAFNDKQLAVEQKESEFQRLGDDQVARKVELLDEMAAIYGGDKAAETLARKQAYIDSTIQKARSEMRSKRYENALSLVNQLETIVPENPALKELRKGLSFGEYEQQLWDALAAGNTDEAYSLLIHLSKVPGYMESHADVVSIADDISQYFIATGNKAMSSYSVVSAYQAYSKARALKVATNKAADYTTEELKFIEFVAKRARGYLSKDNVIPAYGYLSVLEEFNPDHELLVEHAQNINNRVLDMATIKILVSDYADDAKGYQLGKLLTQSLLQTFDRQHLRDVTMTLASSVNASDIAAISESENALSYYFMSGEILQAGVQTLNDTENEARRVHVSYQRIENPDYIAWTKLSKREKRNASEPPATIEQPVYQTVNIEHLNIEKNAEVYSTYRVVDHTRTEVFVSDALSESVTHASKGTSALEQGEFKQPAVAADVLGDKEMLDQALVKTANAVSLKVLDSRVKFFDVYTQTADKAMVEKSYNQALTYYSLRNVINQAGATPDELLLSKLRLSTLYWK
ncbi:Uncharacterised protein [BD1-7 clade bacterium]|uniref:Uncharacterized protein n=1 Tax=BD1-7 clade bacterium TaxID=2029982 RepID=A0A5S9MYL4_9GAMM|nr:Uncharacterised protein [BD1-7 clade bacterium]